MPTWKGFTHLTHGSLVEARCGVYYEGQERYFDNFIVVGFDQDPEEDSDGDRSEMLCVTAADIRDVYRAIKTLESVFERAVSKMDEAQKREIEVDILLEHSLEGEDEFE